jgi:glutathione synthase/RimK-type ligase-like ATP-grasp enzyme
LEWSHQVTAIGVLCARVRVEEKQIIAAIGDAGFLAVPVLPASAPLPPGPGSPGFAILGEILDATTGESMTKSVQLVIDRAPDRAVAAATLPLLNMNGLRTIDAGLAATGSRLHVASALATAGVPRPNTLAGFSEASSNAAVEQLGYPATMLGLIPGSSTTHLHDADTADAVIEHRVVLGDQSEAIILLQAGAPAPERRSIIHVVAGRAIAIDGAAASIDDLAIAERAAVAIGASLVAVELAHTDAGTMVWDVFPVGDFRQARPVSDLSVGQAIANLVIAWATNANVHHQGLEAKVDHGLALIA